MSSLYIMQYVQYCTVGSGSDLHNFKSRFCSLILTKSGSSHLTLLTKPSIISNLITPIEPLLGWWNEMKWMRGNLLRVIKQIKYKCLTYPTWKNRKLFYCVDEIHILILVLTSNKSKSLILLCIFDVGQWKLFFYGFDSVDDQSGLLSEIL